MKSCPECGTRYENYVENCLVDGQLLELLPEEVPAGTDGAGAGQSGSSTLVWLLLVPILLLLLLVGAGVVYLIAQPAALTPKPEPVVAQPPAPTPEPVVVPVPVAVPTLALVTSPSGATVIENGMEVCETPCSVPHPLEASLPRTFIFRLDKHKEGSLVVNEVAGPYLIELKSARRPRPGPRPTNPTPNPTPTPNPSAPKLGRER